MRLRRDVNQKVTKMKKIKTLLIFTLVCAVLSSCSKDAIDGDGDSIIGIWQLSEYKRDTNGGTNNVNLGEDILNILNANNCVLVTFEFKDDDSLEIVNSVNYLQINAGLTGLIVDCPTEKDTNISAYTYDDGVLTYKDKNDVNISAKVSVEGNTLTINAEDLDLPNFDESGELIFKK